MANCPKCNSELSSGEARKFVKAKSGNQLYIVCPVCKAVLKRTINKNFTIVSQVVFAVYFMCVLSPIGERVMFHGNSFYMFFSIFIIVYIFSIFGSNYYGRYEIVDELLSDDKLLDKKEAMGLAMKGMFERTSWMQKTNLVIMYVAIGVMLLLTLYGMLKK